MSGDRYIIIGPPRAGKSTMARKLRDRGIQTYCTDPKSAAPTVEADVTYLPESQASWDDSAVWVAEHWLTMPGPWCIEGVTAVRAIRHALAADPGALDGVQVIRMTEPKVEQTTGQKAMGRAVDSVWQDVEDQLPAVVYAQSGTSRRDHALALRKHSLDLVSPSAYRTEPNAIEARLDIQATEAEEGRALETARVSVAIALALQLQDVVDIIRHPGFSVRTSTIRPDTTDVEVAFARLTAIGSFDGHHGYHRDMRRADPDRKDPKAYGLSSVGTEEMIQLGLSLGRRFARGVIAAVQQVLDNGLSAGAPIEDIVKGVEASYATLIDLAEYPSGLRVLAAQVEPKHAKPKIARRTPGRRMRVADREQYEQWQRQHLPFSKRMRQTLESYAAESARVPRLNKEQAQKWLVTEYTRATNHAAILEANADPDVDKLMYSVWKEAFACGLCLKRNGIVRKKDDSHWLANTPPLHGKCMCRLVAVHRREKVKVTPKADLPDADFELQPGFGGFDPNRVRTMRRLGKAIR